MPLRNTLRWLAAHRGGCFQSSRCRFEPAKSLIHPRNSKVGQEEFLLLCPKSPFLRSPLPLPDLPGRKARSLLKGFNIRETARDGKVGCSSAIGFSPWRSISMNLEQSCIMHVQQSCWRGFKRSSPTQTYLGCLKTGSIIKALSTRCQSNERNREKSNLSVCGLENRMLSLRSSQSPCHTPAPQPHPRTRCFCEMPKAESPRGTYEWHPAP